MSTSAAQDVPEFHDRKELYCLSFLVPSMSPAPRDAAFVRVAMWKKLYSESNSSYVKGVEPHPGVFYLT